MMSVSRAIVVSIAGTLALASCGDDGATSSPNQPANTGIAQNVAPPARQKTTAVPRGTGFDFYVLSLSWSPTWCAQNDRTGKTEQCARGHGLIVHGLWPQNERGYPEYCPTREPDRIPDALGRTLFDIMPSMGLIGHEWRKHGVCSGLSQKDYFAVVRAAHDRIVIPADLRPADLRPADLRSTPQTARTSGSRPIETAFIAGNPGLTPGAIAVTCQARQLDEIRICLDKALDFRACPEVDRDGCNAETLSIPAIP